MQRLWLVVGSIAAVSALTMGTYGAASVIAHEEVVERLTFDTAGITALDLESENGNVDIIGEDVDEISLVSEIGHGLQRTRHTVSIEGTTLVVRDDCPGIPMWCRVDYELVVPTDLVVDVSTDNGGVTVRDLAGDLTVRTSNGPVDATRIGGRLDVRTSNGRIDATGLGADTAIAHTSNGSIDLDFTDAPTRVDTRSSNGSIEIVLPDDGAAYRLDVDTHFGGSTDTAVRTDPSSDRSIVARTSNGSVTVRYSAG